MWVVVRATLTGPVESVHLVGEQCRVVLDLEAGQLDAFGGAGDRLGPGIVAEGIDRRLMVGDERRQPRGDGFLDAAVALAGPGRHREAEHLPVDLAPEALHLIDERGVPFGDEIAAALGPDGEEIGMAVEQFLDDAGDVRSGPASRAWSSCS